MFERTGKKQWQKVKTPERTFHSQFQLIRKKMLLMFVCSRPKSENVWRLAAKLAGVTMLTD